MDYAAMKYPSKIDGWSSCTSRLWIVTKNHYIHNDVVGHSSLCLRWTNMNSSNPFVFKSKIWNSGLSMPLQLSSERNLATIVQSSVSFPAISACWLLIPEDDGAPRNFSTCQWAVDFFNLLSHCYFFFALFYKTRLLSLKQRLQLVQDQLS